MACLFELLSATQSEYSLLSDELLELSLELAEESESLLLLEVTDKLSGSTKSSPRREVRVLKRDQIYFYKQTLTLLRIEEKFTQGFY